MAKVTSSQAMVKVTSGEAMVSSHFGHCLATGHFGKQNSWAGGGGETIFHSNLLSQGYPNFLCVWGSNEPGE